MDEGDQSVLIVGININFGHRGRKTLRLELAGGEVERNVLIVGINNNFGHREEENIEVGIGWRKT